MIKKISLTEDAQAAYKHLRRNAKPSMTRKPCYNPSKILCIHTRMGMNLRNEKSATRDVEKLEPCVFPDVGLSIDTT